MPKVLRPHHASRREIAAPGCPTGAEIVQRIMDFERQLERRAGVGASRWIVAYKPHTDAQGRWQLGPVLGERRRPLSVAEAHEISKRRMEEGTR